MNKNYLIGEKDRIEAEYNELQQNYEAIGEQLKVLRGSYQQVCKIMDDLYPDENLQEEMDDE